MRLPLVLAAVIALLAGEVPAHAVQTITASFLLPSNGFSQTYRFDFSDDVVQSARVSVGLEWNELYYDPEQEELVAIGYGGIEDSCEAPPTCSDGVVRSLVARTDFVQFRLSPPISFNRCVLGRNPYEICAVIYGPYGPLGAYVEIETDGPATWQLTVFPKVAFVPEPRLWALWITGFGLMGAALRHRRQIAA